MPCCQPNSDGSSQNFEWNQNQNLKRPRNKRQTHGAKTNRFLNLTGPMQYHPKRAILQGHIHTIANSVVCKYRLINYHYNPICCYYKGKRFHVGKTRILHTISTIQWKSTWYAITPVFISFILLLFIHSFIHPFTISHIVRSVEYIYFLCVSVCVR